MSPHPFPRLRWAALVWLAVWGSAYAVVWGFANFLHLCDVTVIVTCAGLWWGNRLLLSSQAVASILVDFAWSLDAFWRVVSGGHLLGGWTAYMWDDRFPLAVRLLSLFHVFWPVLLLGALRRTGYDRRAFGVQCVIAVVLTVAARVASPDANINFAHRDPFFDRSWGPAPVHLAAVLSFLCVVIYWPTHLVLRASLPPAPSHGIQTRSAR